MMAQRKFLLSLGLSFRRDLLLIFFANLSLLLIFMLQVTVRWISRASRHVRKWLRFWRGQCLYRRWGQCRKCSRGWGSLRHDEPQQIIYQGSFKKIFLLRKFLTNFFNSIFASHSAKSDFQIYSDQSEFSNSQTMADFFYINNKKISKKELQAPWKTFLRRRPLKIRYGSRSA